MPDERIEITSNGQQGGITAQNVNISNEFQVKEPANTIKKNNIRRTIVIIVGVVTFISSIVAILTYFNITPFNKKEVKMDNDKNVYVNSYNQSGGITANNVNIGSTPRKMDSNLGNQIKQQISLDAEITINAVMGDGEAFSFAQQIKDWLTSNGYSNVNGVNQSVYNKPVMGQIIEKATDNKYNLIIGTREQ